MSPTPRPTLSRLRHGERRLWHASYGGVGFTVELSDELGDALLDLVTDRPYLLERKVLRVGELPADALHTRSHRTNFFAACRNRDVGPVERLLVELARNVIACTFIT